MNHLLEKYTSAGSFTFEPQEDLSLKCNAPYDKAGVYLIYRIKDQNETLIYIGSSGQRDKKGDLKIRKGGLYDRLINGYHPNRFGEEKRIKRKYAFPKHMVKNCISRIKIYWWVTHNESEVDFPTDIEKKLTRHFISLHNRLPEWHKQ